MMVYIPEYHGPRILCSIAHCQREIEEILSMGHNVLLIKETSLTFLPNEITTELPNLISAKLLALKSFDVVEIDNHGLLRSIYLNVSDSNALFVGTCCNCNCRMCPYSETTRRGNKILPVEHLIKIIDYIPSDTPYLTVTGGEPTMLGSGFLELVESLNTCLPNTFIQYLTNGRAFANFEFGSAFRGLLRSKNRVAIPIHAPDAKLHDYITQSAHSFEQTVQGIKIIESGSAEIEIRIVVSKLNYTRMLDIAKLITGSFMRITYVNFMGLEMLGNAARNAETVWIDYRDAFPYIKQAIDYLVANELDVELYNFPLCTVDREYWEICAQSISDYKITFAEKCSECSVKAMCGGFFNSTGRYKKLSIRPLRIEI